MKVIRELQHVAKLSLDVKSLHVNLHRCVVNVRISDVIYLDTICVMLGVNIVQSDAVVRQMSVAVASAQKNEPGLFGYKNV